MVPGPMWSPVEPLLRIQPPLRDQPLLQIHSLHSLQRPWQAAIATGPSIATGPTLAAGPSISNIPKISIFPISQNPSSIPKYSKYSKDSESQKLLSALCTIPLWVFPINHRGQQIHCKIHARCRKRV